MRRARNSDAAGDDDAASGEPDAKRARVSGAEKELAEVEKELNDVQCNLQHLEEKCCEEQIAAQQKFDQMRRPFFDRRGALLRKIPGFWRAALCGHPSKLVHPSEVEALAAIKDVDVRENLDANGSYEVRITLAENDLFKPGVLTKVVTFHDVPLGEDIEAAPLTATSDRGRALLADVRGAARTVLGWLVSTERSADEAAEDFGDLLRRELWQDPMPFFLAYRESAPCADAAPAAAAASSGMMVAAP